MRHHGIHETRFFSRAVNLGSMVGSIWFLYLAGVQSNFHSATSHVQEYHPRLFKHGFLNTSNLLLIPWSNHSRNMMSPPKWSREYHEIGRIVQGKIHKQLPGICSHSFILRFYLTFSWHDSTERLASVQPKKSLQLRRRNHGRSVHRGCNPWRAGRQWQWHLQVLPGTPDLPGRGSSFLPSQKIELRIFGSRTVTPCHTQGKRKEIRNKR